MTKIIAVTNQKGGVGKTTSAVNLAACLAAADKKVLLIDSDPQGNATSGLGLNRDSLAKSVYDVYLNEEKLYVDKGKGDKSGYYPISPAAVEAIHKYWEERNWTEDNPPAFGRHDKQSSKKHLRLKAGGIERIIARLSDQMGMPGVLTPHKYRHHRGTEVTRKYGVHAAQKWLHHENIDTTEGYVDLGDEYIMDIAKEMFTK